MESPHQVDELPGSDEILFALPTISGPDPSILDLFPKDPAESRAFIRELDAYDPLAGHVECVHRTSSRCVISIHGQVVLKAAATVAPAEQGIIEYIKAKTSVPVPDTLLRWYSDKAKRHFILMKQAKGVKLYPSGIVEGVKLIDPNPWISMDERCKRAVVDEAWKHLREVRQLTSGRICSPDDSPLQEGYLTKQGRFLRFTGDNQADQLLNQMIVYAGVDVVTAAVVRELHARHLEKNPEDRTRFVMTHGDLGPYNIQFDQESKSISCILDWETSGFLPAWWERCKLITTVGDGPPDWVRMLAERMPRCPEMEAAMALTWALPSRLLTDEEARKIYDQAVQRIGHLPILSWGR